MATPGYDLAEVYVMRKLHKEKMKREEEERAKTGEIDFKVKKSTGCFSSIFKKVHPSHVSTLEHDRKQVKSCNKEDKGSLGKPVN